jgi:seryl-tRNA synthetase
MIDIKALRQDLTGTVAALARRGYTFPVDEFTALEGERKELQTRTQELQNLRNTQSKAIGAAKGRGEDIEPLLAEVAGLGDELKAGEERLAGLQARLDAILLGVPNLLHASVPDGTGEDDNVEIRRWGEPPTFDFDPRDHVALGELSGRMDFETATAIASARFVLLSGVLARMLRALAQVM